VFGWIEPFFEPCEAAVEPGHVWTDQPIYLPPRHGLTIERVDPNDDRRLNFTIGGRTAEIFNHPPVHSLRLESTEGAVVAKTKRDRPVIMLGGTSSSELSAGGDRAHLADTVMVVPVYGADQVSEHMRGVASLTTSSRTSTTCRPTANRASKRVSLDSITCSRFRAIISAGIAA